jgi:hypothetical protein
VSRRPCVCCASGAEPGPPVRRFAVVTPGDAQVPAGNRRYRWAAARELRFVVLRRVFDWLARP